MSKKVILLKKIFKSPLVFWVIISLLLPDFPQYIFKDSSIAQAALDENELEYMINIGPLNGSTAANYVYASFFNPSGSGRTALIKRIAIRAYAVAAANYVNLTLRRITSASGGTIIPAADIPKKNTNSSDPVTQVRYNGVSVTLAGTVNSRILSQTMPGGTGQWHSIRDITFGPNDEKLILKPGEGIALYQEAAGDADHRISIYVEWEEVSTTPSPKNEFLFAFPRVENAASTNYVYNSFFNPSTSGKTAIIKRIWFGAETCDASAIYTNNISLKRISSASGGTAINSSEIPKKNTGSSNSTMDIRYASVIVTQVGGQDARLGMVTPCGLSGQPHGWMRIDFHPNDEKLILQPGEGIALISEKTGDADQLVRMIIEWEEVPSTNTPSPQGEYILAFPRISDEAVAPANGTTFYTFFNPANSGKTAVIKRLVIRVDADAEATYAVWNFQRISAASGGILISAADIPKKHTGSAVSIIEARYCGTTCRTAINATYVGHQDNTNGGTSDSGIFKAIGPGTTAQVIGHREIVFGDNEKFVLQPGEGLGFYVNYTSGDTDHYVKILIEWSEVSSTPNSQGEYLINIGPIPGSTALTYNYVSFFNPSNSGKTAVIKRISLRIDAAGAAVYIPMCLRFISSASGGTQIASVNIPKKNSKSPNSLMDIRRNGVTVTYSQAADAQLISVQTPGAPSSAVSPQITGYKELIFVNDERIILKPGQGIVLHQNVSGSANHRVQILIEWQETTSTPDSQGEYLMTVGPIQGSLNSGYVYVSFFNPTNSGKNYVVKRIGIQADRISTLTVPYIPATLRKISSVSGGTQIISDNIPPKHSDTSISTADIRHSGVTVTFSGSANSKLLSVIVPGAVGQMYGTYEIEIIFGDELILKPGEGIALYQEANAGDTNVVFRFSFEWKEVSIAATISCTLSSVSTSFSNLSPSTVSTSFPDIELHITSNGGFQILVRDAGDGSNAGLYKSASPTYLIQSSDATLSAGIDGYGIQATTTNPSIFISSKYNKTGNDVGGLSLTDIQLASSTQAVSNAVIIIKHKASASYLAPTGNYSDTITYTCSLL